MATPVKAITYLTGVYPQAQAVLVPRPLTLTAQTMLIGRLMRPLWKPLRIVAVQTQAKTVLVPRPLMLAAMTALKTTLFWRGSNALPPRGQRYPLSR